MSQLVRVQMADGSFQMLGIQSNSHLPNVSNWFQPGMPSMSKAMPRVLDALLAPSTLGLVVEQASRRLLPDALPPTSTPSVVGGQASRRLMPDALPPTRGEPDASLDTQHGLQTQLVDGVQDVCDGKNTDNTVITSSQGSVSDPSEQQDQRPQSSESQRQSMTHDNTENIGQGMPDGLQQTIMPQSGDSQTCLFCMTDVGTVSLNKSWIVLQRMRIIWHTDRVLTCVSFEGLLVNASSACVKDGWVWQGVGASCVPCSLQRLRRKRCHADIPSTRCAWIKPSL